MHSRCRAPAARPRAGPTTTASLSAMSRAGTSRGSASPTWFCRSACRTSRNFHVSARPGGVALSSHARAGISGATVALDGTRATQAVAPA